jgi:hypothetical protein
VAAACAAPGSDAVRQPLEALLAHARAGVRSGAGLALAARGGSGSHEALTRWLELERDALARGDALLAIGVTGAADALPLLAKVGGGEFAGRAEDVRRTVAGRRDPQLLGEELDARLAALAARERDRRDASFAELLAEVFHFDALDRRRGTGGGDGDGGSGGDDGGGEPPPDEGGSPLGKAKIDRKPSAVERDLAAWFEDAPYFRARR